MVQKGSPADLYFASIFKPGAAILTSGFKGGGKSHTAVAVAERLVKGAYPSVGKVVVVTNMIFFHKVDGHILVETPPDVHHITTMKELFPLVVQIIEEHGRDVVILMILDEAQNFIGGDSNQTNASVMMKEFLGTIRKFRLVVWFLTPSARGIGPAFRNYLNDKNYPGNLTCKFKKDLALNAQYIAKHHLPYTPKELMLVKAYDSDAKFLRVPVTEWTGTRDTLKEGGYCYDHEASATFYVGDDFDWELFNRTIGGVSSIEVLSTIKRYYREHHSEVITGAPAEKLPAPEVTRKQTQVEIAVNLLNRGMTEKEVAESMKLSRDQLRYRIGKAGYVKVSRATESGVEKVWVSMNPHSEEVHTNSTTARRLCACVKGGSKNPPIYISKETPSNEGVDCVNRHKPGDGRGPSFDDQAKAGEGVSGHDCPTPLPDGRYGIDELRRAVQWCIGDDVS